MNLKAPNYLAMIAQYTRKRYTRATPNLNTKGAKVAA